MSVYVGKELSTLGTRAMYNKTLRHLVSVTSIVEQVEKGRNLGDILNGMLEEQTLTREQIAPIISVVMISRMNVPVKSMNMVQSFNDFGKMVQHFSRWNAVDIVVAYHHPNLGIQLINPASQSDWEDQHEIKRDELIVAYARSHKKDQNVAEKALDAFFTILQGRAPQEDPAFIMEVPKPVAPAAPAPAPAAAAPAAPAPAAPTPAPAAKPKAKPAGKKNISPRYSVQVTNELFHNGNVEAWKNIIEAYQAKTGLQVIVYHEGELIQDLNSLFKWGKVKHGGVISFQVAGENLKFVSRLQKYLFEGASARFEAFLKKDINKVINIF